MTWNDSIAFCNDKTHTTADVKPLIGNRKRHHSGHPSEVPIWRLLWVYLSSWNITPPYLRAPVKTSTHGPLPTLGPAGASENPLGPTRFEPRKWKLGAQKECFHLIFQLNLRIVRWKRKHKYVHDGELQLAFRTVVLRCQHSNVPIKDLLHLVSASFQKKVEAETRKRGFGYGCKTLHEDQG